MKIVLNVLEFFKNSMKVHLFIAKYQQVYMLCHDSWFMCGKYISANQYLLHLTPSPLKFIEFSLMGHPSSQ